MKRDDWIAIFVLVLAICLRLSGIDKSVWIDEAGSLFQATHGNFWETARNYDHPPLYFLLIKYLFLASSAPEFLRLFSVAAGTAVVGIIYLGLRMFHSKAAILAAFGAAVHPHLIYHSQEIRHYALLHMFLVAALALAPWIHGRSAAAVMAGVSYAAACATHLVAVFFFPSLILAALSQTRVRTRHEAWRMMVVFAPGFLLALALKEFFLIDATKDPSTWWMPAATGASASNAILATLGWTELEWVADAVERNLRIPMPAFSAAAGLSLAALTVAPAVVRDAPAARWFMLASIVFGVGIVGYSFFAVSLLWPRLLLPMVLPALCAVSLALTAILGRPLRLSLIFLYLAGTSTLAIPWIRWQHAVPKEDFRTFASVCVARSTPETLHLVFGGTELGIEIYWPEFIETERMLVDIREPVDLLWGEIDSRLKSGTRHRQVNVIYRIDAFHKKHHDTYRLIVSMLKDEYGAPERVTTTSLVLERFGPDAGEAPD